MHARPSIIRIALLLALLTLLAVGCSSGPTAEAVEPTEEAPPTEIPVEPTPTRTPVPAEAVNVTPVPPAVEESALVGIRRRGELRVGVLFNYLPLAGLAENGEVQGYEAALARHIAERWGVDITFVQVTRQTGLPMLFDGEVDMLAAAMPHRRELEQYVEFTNTTFSGGYAVLVRADTAEQGLGILGNGAVAAVGEDAVEVLEQQAERLGFQPAVQRYDSLTAAVQALADIQVNSVVARREQLMLPDQSSDGFALLEELLLQEPYAFVVRRGDVALRDLLNLTIQDIIAAGELGNIFSTSFYGLPADVLPEWVGEPSFTFENFPAELPQGPSVFERIQRGEPLRVAGLELAEEYRRVDSHAIYDGYSRAVVNEMARRWGVSVEELPQTAGQAGLDRLLAGEADLVVGLRSDLGLVGQVALSDAYYTRGLRLIHLEDVNVLSVLDLEVKPSVATTPVDESQAIIEDNNYAPRVTVMESFEEAYEGLLSRAYYAVVGDEYALMLMAQEDDTIEVDERLYRPQEFVMGLPRHDPDFLSLVNFTLQDMYQDGTLDELRRQYFGPYQPPDTELEPLQMEVWPGDGSYLGIGQYSP